MDFLDMIKWKVWLQEFTCKSMTYRPDLDISAQIRFLFHEPK